MVFHFKNFTEKTFNTLLKVNATGKILNLLLFYILRIRMGQFFIDGVGDIRFDCDCGTPLQPIITKTEKTIKCNKCGSTFINPFHESNPYDMDKKWFLSQEVQGIVLRNYFYFLYIILILSILSGVIVLFINFKYGMSIPNVLSLDIFLPTIIIAIITLMSLVSIFAVFGKNRILEIRKDHVISIKTIIRKYCKIDVNLSNILHYKFDSRVLDGLKKEHIGYSSWFSGFLFIETTNHLENKVIDEGLLKRIIPIGLIIAVPSIALLPISPMIHEIQFLEISILVFLSLFSILELLLSFGYIMTVIGILSIDVKFFYWYVAGEKVLRVSRLLDMKKINSNGGNLNGEDKMKKIRNHMKKFSRVYKLEIVLFIPAIVSFFVVYFFGENIGTQGQIYLYIALFYFASWFMTVILIELIRASITEEAIIKLKKRVKRKPKIYEYIFFLGLFWATAILTDAYSHNITTGLDLLNFLNIFGFSIFIYGIASACGWYHYIERFDDGW